MHVQPLFNSILGFNLKASTALSHTTVSVSAIASSLYGFYQVRMHRMLSSGQSLQIGCSQCQLPGSQCLHAACCMRRRPVLARSTSAQPGSACWPEAWNLLQTSPNDSSRPLADLDLVITFLPALLLGVSIGTSLICSGRCKAKLWP